jgi:hypothetical protein
MNTRSNWQRLHDIAEKRREYLGLAQTEVAGVSAAWIRDLKDREGAPSTRQRPKLDALDLALGWDKGTAWSLARDPFEDDSVTAIDQEDRLVHGDETTCIPDVPTALEGDREQAIRDFGTIVMRSLRVMDDATAEDAMARIVQLLGIE